jgi:peptidyl-prolyl cis-trans isomerase SurA
MKFYYLPLFFLAIVLLSACNNNAHLTDDAIFNKDVSVHPVIATVNGEDIDRAFFQKNLLNARQNALAQGSDPFNVTVNADIRTEVLDQMVNNVLLAQAAESDDITVEDTVIDEQVEALIAQYETKEALEKQLQINGSSFEELQEDLRRTHTVELFLEHYFEEVGIVVSEVEMQTVYNEAAAEQEVPTFDEVKAQIEQQLLQQKQHTAVTSLLEVLRAKAEINKF